MAAVEVERLGLAPQPLDHRARLREGIDGVCEVEVGQAVGVVLAAGLRHARPRAGADSEVEPSAGDDVDGGGDLGQHRRGAQAVAGHQQAEAQPPGLGRDRREQRPALVDRSEAVPPDRHQMVEQPCVLDFGNGVGLVPHTHEVGVVDLLGRGCDPEGEMRGSH